MQRFVLALAAMAVAATAIVAAAVPAWAESCEDLWYARNAIYKEAGYCFKTARAIRAFGNSGCGYDDVGAVPLSRGQRATVADIVRQERDQGCAP